MTNKQALEHAQAIVSYCKARNSCQNCIFRQHGAENWRCHIQAFDLDDVLRNIAAKKKNGGYL